MCPRRHVGYGFTSLVPRLILFSVHQKENWKCFDTCIAKLSCYHFILSFWNVSLSAHVFEFSKYFLRVYTLGWVSCHDMVQSDELGQVSVLQELTMWGGGIPNSSITSTIHDRMSYKTLSFVCCICGIKLLDVKWEDLCFTMAAWLLGRDSMSLSLSFFSCQVEMYLP